MSKTAATPRSLNKRLLSWSTQLFVALLALLAVEAFLTRDSTGLIAPAIDAPTLNQQPFSLAQFKGRPAIIHFWATWCPVCELEQGVINGIAADLPIITVAMQSGSSKEILDYLQQQGVAYPVINDPNGSLAEQYGVKAVPASFILDSEGRVRFATRGYTTGPGLRIRLWLAGWF